MEKTHIASYDTLRTVGKNCQNFRKRLGYTQADVEKDLHYCRSAVSSFERGKNDSTTFLLWYVKHGMTAKEIIEGCEL